MKMPQTIPMLTPVKESSNILSIGYEPENRRLYVLYKPKDDKGDGALYRYDNVPEGTWARLYRSHSKGTHIWTHIKGKFKYWKWTGRTWQGQTALKKAQSEKRKLAEQAKK